jgi:type I restriction enzyme, S subunit
MTWQRFVIGDFLNRIKEPVSIKPSSDYCLVTIRMYHKGVAARSRVKGSQIKSSTLYKVQKGQFILSGIDARNGAFGIVPEDLDGAVISNDFWTHSINEDVIDLEYFYWYTSTQEFYDICIAASEGTTNRQRLQASKFYDFELNLPSLAEQREIVKRIAQVNIGLTDLRSEVAKQQTYLGQLRQSILQEAVQGKLVPQDPNDEPASELLKKIKAEKEKLIAEGKLKKEKPLPPITAEEAPFELPKGWVWCRLGEILDILLSGYAFKSTDLTKVGKNQVLRLGNVKNDSLLLFSNPVFVTDEVATDSASSKLQIGDILLTMTGTRLKRDYCFTTRLTSTHFEGRKLYLNQRVGCLRFNRQLNSQYIVKFLKAESLLDFLFDRETGTANQGNIGVEMIKHMLFPLAPLEEQNRIVRKLEIQSDLIGKLLVNVNKSQSDAEQLLRSILREAFNDHANVYQIEENISISTEQ